MKGDKNMARGSREVDYIIRFSCTEPCVLRNRAGIEFDIYRDRKTGVNYLVSATGGITPLLDEEGKTVITKES